MADIGARLDQLVAKCRALNDRVDNMDIQRRQHTIIRKAHNLLSRTELITKAISDKTETQRCDKEPTQSQQTPPSSLSSVQRGSRAVEPSSPGGVVLRTALDMGLTSACVVRTPMDYYDWTLEQRRDFLGAPSVSHLCKSLIMENTKCTVDNCDDPKNSRYYCIVIQYETKLNTQNVFRFVKDMNKGSIPRDRFKFRLAPDEVSAELTGYGHNAVPPIGWKHKIPMIMSKRIVDKLAGQTFWLGGGEVDVKLGSDPEEFVAVVQPYVVDICFEPAELVLPKPILYR